MITVQAGSATPPAREAEATRFRITEANASPQAEISRLITQLTSAIMAGRGEATASVNPAPYVTIKLAATITGLSEKAIRRKIEEGKWLDGREYRRSPDGGVFISINGYAAWVERGMS